MCVQSVLDQFDSLTLGPSAPGQQQDPMQSPAYYPRPTGDEAAAARAPLPPAHPGNCDARFMRPTVNAIASQQVLFSQLLSAHNGYLLSRVQSFIVSLHLSVTQFSGSCLQKGQR